VNKADKLRNAIKVLSEPLRPEARGRKETPGERRLRLDARREAEARLREHDSAVIRYEVYELPHVRKELDRRVSNRVAEVELREHLRGEPEPLPEAASLAQRALARAARSDAEKAREAARLNWPTTEGWMTDVDG
jgi:hypothetical protein